MTKEQALVNLIMVMNFDKRLRVHTLNEVDTNILRHTNSCARCCGLYVLGIESDWIDPIELSTVTDLQTN